MSTATQAQPVMHRMHSHVTDGVVTYDWPHEDHYVTAAQALASRIQRLRNMGRPYSVDGMQLTYTDPDGFTYVLTYGDVPA